MPSRRRPDPLTERAARELIAALGAGSGIVAAVGAGGKKTTLQRLAEAHTRLATGRIALVASAQMAHAPADLGFTEVVAPPEAIEAQLSASRDHPRVLLAAPPTKPGRLAGLPPELILRLHTAGGFRVSLIKADGARMRGIKAPAEDEPLIPGQTTTVLALVSIAVLGRPLDATVAHRPERLSQLLGVALGEPLQAHHLATLLASPTGALQRTGTARVVPVLNAVDTPARQKAARQVAEMALARTDRFERIVLASMRRAQPVVAVVRRES